MALTRIIILDKCHEQGCWDALSCHIRDYQSIVAFRQGDEIIEVSSYFLAGIVIAATSKCGITGVFLGMKLF